jgi:hypothetical protein
MFRIDNHAFGPGLVQGYINTASTNPLSNKSFSRPIPILNFAIRLIHID